ncbi:MAG: ribonuclease HII [Rhizobiales bacterium]|nr:ribonuclease HII [Hyphomicrobiales bacterium]
MAAAPDFTRESLALLLGQGPVCGIDEAGRGPWAGPVVAAAVILDSCNIPPGLNDSKLLSPARRAELYDALAACATIGVGVADVNRIDSVNILQATLWAMAEALAQLPEPPGLALIDGNRAPKLSCTVQTVVGGDACCLSIAAASIIAKVTRDRIMVALDLEYPSYGFASHKGYGTEFHAAALREHGVTPHHRRSFAPVAGRLAR